MGTSIRHRWAGSVPSRVRAALTALVRPARGTPPPQPVLGRADAMAADDLARAFTNAGAPADSPRGLPWDRLSGTARAAAAQEAWRWIVAARDAGYSVTPLPPPGYTIAPPLPPGYTAALTPSTVVLPAPPWPPRDGDRTYETVTVDGDAVLSAADLARQLRRCTDCGSVVHRDARAQHDRFHARLSSTQPDPSSR